MDAMFTDPPPVELGHTHALLVVHRGSLVVERYGHWFAGELEALAGDAGGEVTPEDRHISWSMAKSIGHGLVGLLAGDGALELDGRPPVPQWSDVDDPRYAIGWDDLLTMRAGLQWTEEYYDFDDSAVPDVVEMLWGEGHRDMAAFAAGFMLVHPPGSTEAYRYSSGTSNIAAAAAQTLIEGGGGGEAACRSFLVDRLFGPLGMGSADPGFDEVGTFVASSYVYASAEDFARFGLWYLRDGVWEGERLLPEGWVDHGRLARSPDDDVFHGAHWWARDDALGTFYADGFEGQRIICVPALDVVVVRLGKTHADHTPTLDAHLGRIVDAFR